MKTTLLAAALTLVGGAALAENTATLQFGSFAKQGDDTTIASLTTKGSANRFFYETDLAYNEINDFEIHASQSRLHWSGLGYDALNIGPAVQHNAVSIEGIGDDFWSAGVGVTASHANQEVRAYLMAPVEDTDYWTFDASWDTRLSARTTLLQTYSYSKSVFSDQHAYSVGARYDVTPRVFVQGTAVLERSFDDTGTGVLGGVGFRF